MGIFNNINAILGVVVAGLTLFGFFQNKMTNNERRLTILEEKNNQQDRELAEIKNILDNHNQQMKVLIKMTEQIKNMSEKIEKIDKKLEKVK
ncbi:holin [Streptococcus phage CHPC927]|uniref:Holin n=1 Tax=Streptococcus phage CHPC927 TaxID=2365048 RepID=A0A3G8F7U7_9CAUD|nr:holin [Streptococcus phage CHPC927]AZF90867.1 holin [Streptococcus phage CHPC927]